LKSRGICSSIGICILNVTRHAVTCHVIASTVEHAKIWMFWTTTLCPASVFKILYACNYSVMTITLPWYYLYRKYLLRQKISYSTHATPLLLSNSSRQQIKRALFRGKLTVRLQILKHEISNSTRASLLVRGSHTSCLTPKGEMPTVESEECQRLLSNRQMYAAGIWRGIHRSRLHCGKCLNFRCKERQKWRHAKFRLSNPFLKVFQSKL